MATNTQPQQDTNTTLMTTLDEWGYPSIMDLTTKVEDIDLYDPSFPDVIPQTDGMDDDELFPPNETMQMLDQLLDSSFLPPFSVIDSPKTMSPTETLAAVPPNLTKHQRLHHPQTPNRLQRQPSLHRPPPRTNVTHSPIPWWRRSWPDSRLAQPSNRPTALAMRPCPTRRPYTPSSTQPRRRRSGHSMTTQPMPQDATLG